MSRRTTIADLRALKGSAVEMEVVPVAVAAWITPATPLITLGMGCGSVCNAQDLFSCDVLGKNTARMPRHGKHMRVDAFRAFAEDVLGGGCPEKRHEVHVPDDVVAAAKALVG